MRGSAPAPTFPTHSINLPPTGVECDSRAQLRVGRSGAATEIDLRHRELSSSIVIELDHHVV